MSRESVIVIGGMFVIVVALAVVRLTYDDISAAFDKPSEEQIVQEQQAIQELAKATDALDTTDLIAGVEPCELGRKLNAACLTVTPNWDKAQNRQQVATEIWKNWSTICTGRHLAEEPSDCYIHIKSPNGEALGGSGEENGARIWIKQ